MTFFLYFNSGQIGHNFSFHLLCNSLLNKIGLGQFKGLPKVDYFLLHLTACQTVNIMLSSIIVKTCQKVNNMKIH